MTTANEVIEFAERVGRPMTPWQRKLTEAMFSGFDGTAWRPVMASRPHGRTAHKRVLTEFAAFNGEHVHSAGHDGEWCVTLQPVGFLYARMRPLGSLLRVPRV